MPISSRAVFNAIAVRCGTVPYATAYYGAVGRPVPGAAVPADPPTKSSIDLRTAPYLVVFPSSPAAGPDEALCDDLLGSGRLTVQVTCVAGDVEDLLALIDRVDAALCGWTPVVVGVLCGRLRRPEGFNPPVLTDRAFSPERLYAPLQFQFTAHI